MTEPDLLDELLDTWSESQSAGRESSADELCHNYPHLKPEFERRLRAFRAVDALRLPRASDTTAIDDASATVTAAPAIVAQTDLGRLGDYRLIRLLGEGGMGSVYLAEHTRLKRLDALKVMRPEQAASAPARERFLREAQTAAAVKHDHIVTIYHVGEENGTPYIAMELLEGESLDERLRRDPPLAPAEVVRIAREAADGLAAAHARGLIHRDVKPSNLFLSAVGHGGQRVKLLDFGLARFANSDTQVTQTGAVVGSPAFMSPEQAAGQQLDARSDLFSLGIVLYRLTAGKLPFGGQNTLVLMRQIDTHTPTPPRQLRSDVPPELSALIMRMLAKKPANRPASAAEVVQALRNIEKHVGVDFGAETAAVEAAPRRARRAWLLPIFGAIALIVIVPVVLVAWPKKAALPALHDVPNTAAPTTAAPLFAALKGSIDIDVRATKDGPARRINRPENVPVKPGEWIRIEMKLNRAAYIYVIWLDTEGHATPLYPWEDERWDRRQAEKPQQFLSLPEQAGALAPIGGGPAGVESLLMLVRDTPLPADADLKAVFTKLPAQKRADVQTSALFENGELVPKEVSRGALKLGEAAQGQDPILVTQSLLRTRLKELFPYTRAVCFGNTGDR
ncbi:MAG: protein kinase domain-containing protein [Gemmataceae bacterium]